VSATATRSSKYGYSRLLSLGIVDRPGDKRRQLPIGRGGTLVKPRKFHLSDEEIASLREAHNNGDKLPNPQNRGSYFYIIEALKALGLNRRHPFGEVVAKIRELMSDKDTVQEDKKGKKTTAWQRFIHKEAATKKEENARDVEGKIHQNMEVLQRVNLASNTPYGLKLLQVGKKVLGTSGATIDLLKGDDDAILVRLNTDAAAPTNEFKRVRRADATAKPKTKTQKKAKKPAGKKTTTKVAATKEATSSKPKAKRVRKPKAETVANTATAEPAAETETETVPSGEIAETV
jgi:hypothetical protein